jgi:hypothetical protein
LLLFRPVYYSRARRVFLRVVSWAVTVEKPRAKRSGLRALPHLRHRLRARREARALL